MKTYSYLLGCRSKALVETSLSTFLRRTDGHTECRHTQTSLEPLSQRDWKWHKKNFLMYERWKGVKNYSKVEYIAEKMNIKRSKNETASVKNL